MALCACGAAGAQTDPPLVTTPEWFVWYQSLLNTRLAACPLARGTTYYFSQSGNDVTGNGSMANPWKTLVKAQSIVSAANPTGNVALLFKRGDVWHEQVGIESNTPNITIADYGTGEKPVFTAFKSVGLAQGWMPVPGTVNTYRRRSSDYVSWVKEDDDLDHPYCQQGGIEGVEGYPGSWYWDGAAYLYIHPKHGANGMATDPRIDGKPYEWAKPTLSGVLIRGDRTRVQNIRTLGWGLTPVLGTQRHGIDCRVSGTAQAVFVGCESHYGLSHAITLLVESSGGTVTFVDCRAGWLSPIGGGAGTVFNTYSTYGGNSAIFDHCTVTHGTLPSFALSADTRYGIAFYGHTDSQPNHYMGLTIANGCVIRNTPFGCGAPATFADLTPASSLQDVRCFVVNELMEGGPGTGSNCQVGITNAARVNSRLLNLRPPPLTSAALAGWSSGGWVINSTIEVDCTQQPINFALFNGNAWDQPVLHIWNSHIRAVTRPSIMFSLDWDFPTHSTGSTVINTIISNTGGGTCIPNLGGPGGLAGNAYFGVSPQAAAADAQAIVLTEEPLIGAEPACVSVLACSATPLPAGLELHYDQRGYIRHRNAKGPIQAPPCGNCDGSTAAPVFNVVDFQCFLNKYAAGDPQANCDGSSQPPALNLNDLQCFLNKYSAGCW